MLRGMVGDLLAMYVQRVEQLFRVVLLQAAARLAALVRWLPRPHPAVLVLRPPYKHARLQLLERNAPVVECLSELVRVALPLVVPSATAQRLGRARLVCAVRLPVLLRGAQQRVGKVAVLRYPLCEQVRQVVVPEPIVLRRVLLLLVPFTNINATLKRQFLSTCMARGLHPTHQK